MHKFDSFILIAFTYNGFYSAVTANDGGFADLLAPTRARGWKIFKRAIQI